MIEHETYNTTNQAVNEIRTEIINKINSVKGNQLPGNQVVFLVGAGVSREEPSSVPSFPQENCLKRLPDLQGMGDTLEDLKYRIRPEFFFQILYAQLGERGLMPLDALNTRKLNANGASIRPNAIHEFLAEMLEMGHIVLTTNFDSLIEDAYAEKTGKTLENYAIYDDDFEKLKNEGIPSTGCLIKIHGSFYSPSGKDTKDSIVALLSQLQRAITRHKIELIRELLRKHDWIVLGHSMRDEYDLYPALSDPRQKKRNIYWIKHTEDTNSGIVTRGKKSFVDALKAGGAQPLSAIPWAEVSRKNVYSVLASYADQTGVLIEANTLQFVNSLRKRTPGVMGPVSGSGRFEDEIIALWSESLNTIEQKKISAELLKNLNTREGDQKALALYKEAGMESNKHLLAQVYLEEADISYRQVRKRMDHTELSGGKRKACAALQIFTDLHDREGMADAYYVLTHLNRLENKATEGIECGLHAIRAYVTVVTADRTKDYKLAGALRSLALVVMNTVPDLPPLENDGQKKELEDLLSSCGDLCSLSEKIYGEIGNATGERGLNQTLNVHGLIALRMGHYDQAEILFERYIDLSDASRFIREGHQGYRNLGLCELSLATKNPEREDEYCNKSIESFRKCLWCLGLNPENLREELRSEEHRKNSNVFNTLYNYAKALVFCSHPDKNNIMEILAEYNNEERLREILGNDYRNWQCRLLALLCQAEEDEERAKRYAEDMLKIYREQGVDAIRKLRFGPQNYNENMTIVLNRFPLLLSSLEELPKKMDLAVSLPFEISEITGQLKNVCEEIRKLLAER